MVKNQPGKKCISGLSIKFGYLFNRKEEANGLGFIGKRHSRFRLYLSTTLRGYRLYRGYWKINFEFLRTLRKTLRTLRLNIE